MNKHILRLLLLCAAAGGLSSQANTATGTSEPLSAETSIAAAPSTGSLSGSAPSTDNTSGSIRADSLAASPLSGVWQNPSRFAEFSADGRLRLILKPYYGFVYEDAGWMPCAVQPLDTTTSAFILSIRYPGTRADVTVPAAVIGDGLWFGFYRRLDGAVSAQPAETAQLAETTQLAPPVQPAQPASGGAPLDGFWMAEGAPASLRMYVEDRSDEFYCYYFAGSAYCRIRYWKTDAQYRDIGARFTDPAGKAVEIPKFIRIGGDLYTCITSTGKILRNYETGAFSIAGGFLTFVPANVVYAGTAAAVRSPVRVTRSAEGSVLAFGESDFRRTAITDLDAEITAHNGLRRPPRKPVFGYMDLDFRWDEIERIRNNGKPGSSD
jgi:hypothetical protein